MSEQPATRPDIPEFDLADRIRLALRRSGIGVQEIADYLECSRTAVSSWINGRNTPTPQTLRLIAMRCGVNYPWLRTGQVPASATNNDDPGPGTSAQVTQGGCSGSLPPHFHAQITPITPIRTTGPLTEIAA